MREVIFLRNNKDKWQKFETMIEFNKTVDPDELAELYLITMDDLSYARTYYPGSKTYKYLNQLSSKIHRAIYRNKKEETNRFIKFWKYELPLEFKKIRKQLHISLFIFVLGILVGIVSSANDDSYVRLILGDHYVNMTIDNIDNDDPMAVYKKANEIDMFLGITFNNIMVSFNAFVLGIFFSFGTGYVLFANGVMLGAFQHFFYRHGLLWESMRSVWIHGTLEISAIVIAGAAGIVLGNSILFPGTYKRVESFKLGAKKGIKIVVGLIPIFITAGFLESFVTRYTGMPIALSLCIIGFSAAFIIYYFYIYPHSIHKQNGTPYGNT